MPDFPLPISVRNPISIGPFNIESIGMSFVAGGGNAAASTAWPSANLAIYIPVEIRYVVTIVKMSVNNGTAVSGNIDVGIYDANQNKIVTAGSTAQSGTSAIQTFDITDKTLYPGLYYMGVALDNGTGTLAGWTVSNAIDIRASGICQQASAFALPSPAVFAAYAQTFIPMISMTPKTTI